MVLNSLKSDPTDTFVVKSIVEMTFGQKLTDLNSSPKDRQLQKSCVSFGEECAIHA